MNIFQWNELQIYSFFFVLVRVTSLLVFLPIFGDRTIPPLVKIFFGVTLSSVVFPFVYAAGHRIDLAVIESDSKAVWAVCCEVGFGMMVGFVARWIFDAAQFAGHFAGTAMGFSMASVLDPHTETQNTSMSEMQYILAAMLFLAMNGHHIYLQAILESFKLVHIGGVNLLANGDSVIQYLIQMTAEVLALGLKLSAPVVVVLLLLNLTFGIVARTVPQLNVFVVSFTINIIVGLLAALISAPGFTNMIASAFDAYTPELFKFMRLFHG